MRDDPLSLAAGFPPLGADDWRQSVEAPPKGRPVDRLVARTEDGLPLAPLHTRADAVEPTRLGAPGAPPYVRGAALERGWLVVQRVDDADPDAARLALLEDLEQGADGLELRLDRALRSGRGALADPEGVGLDGVPLHTAAALSRLLAGVDPARVHLSAEPGAAFAPVSAALLAWHDAATALTPGPAARLSLGADPLGALARFGALPGAVDAALEDLGAFGRRVAGRDDVVLAAADDAPAHDAGASPAQALGFVLASGVASVRALLAAGLSPDEALAQVELRLSLEPDVLPAVAGLRAARRAWARIAEAFGASPARQAARIAARTAARVLTRRDPWVNLLRGTATAFAAAVGGAERICVASFTARLGPSALGRRLARNTQHVLRHEAQLARVLDPAGGSWFVEQHTEALARAAWAELQRIEAEGGLAASLGAGRVQARIAETRATRDRALATRRRPITGVSEFARLDEAPVEVELRDRAALAAAVRAALADAPAPTWIDRGDAAGRVEAWLDAAQAGADLGAMAIAAARGTPATAEALEPRPLADAFEALRDASAAAAVAPSLALIKLGPVSEHTARVGFARAFFEAGGVRAVDTEAAGEAGGPEAAAEAAVAAWRESGAPMAVLCGADARYALEVEATARALRAAGCRRLYLAGRPGAAEDAWRGAGVDDFVFLGADLVQTLGAALDFLEIPR